AEPRSRCMAMLVPGAIGPSSTSCSQQACVAKNWCCSTWTRLSLTQEKNCVEQVGPGLLMLAVKARRYGPSGCRVMPEELWPIIWRRNGERTVWHTHRMESNLVR